MDPWDSVKYRFYCITTQWNVSKCIGGRQSTTRQLISTQRFIFGNKRNNWRIINCMNICAYMCVNRPGINYSDAVANGDRDYTPGVSFTLDPRVFIRHRTEQQSWKLCAVSKHICWWFCNPNWFPCSLSPHTVQCFHLEAELCIGHTDTSPHMCIFIIN
jgi:hypothetical protein